MNKDNADASKFYKEFVDDILDVIGMSCYLAIMPNDDGYDIEVETSSGTIAGNFATNTHDLDEARVIADRLDREIRSRNVKVYKTRTAWERSLG
jgi:hypothetical protein